MKVCPLHSSLDRKVYEINNRLWKFMIAILVSSSITSFLGAFWGGSTTAEIKETKQTALVYADQVEMDAGVK